MDTLKSTNSIGGLYSVKGLNSIEGAEINWLAVQRACLVCIPFPSARTNQKGGRLLTARQVGLHVSPSGGGTTGSRFRGAEGIFTPLRRSIRVVLCSSVTGEACPPWHRALAGGRVLTTRRGRKAPLLV
jgi:hypothetical protein